MNGYAVLFSLLTVSAGLTVLPGWSNAIPQTATRLDLAPPFGLPQTVATQMRPDSHDLSIPNGVSPSYSELSRAFREDRNTLLAFASLQQSNAVNVYNNRGQLLGEIKADLHNPSGLAIDVQKSLYVANTDTIAIFAFPYSGRPRILRTPDYLPQGVAVSRTGLVAALNYCLKINCTAAYVVGFYLPNTTKPCATVPITGGNNLNIVGNAGFDHAGNLYLAGQNGPGQYVGEISGGCNATGVQTLTTNNVLGQLSGVQVDKMGRIAILGLNSAVISTYNPPVNGSLGSPVSTTTLGKCGGAFSYVLFGSGNYVLANCNLANLNAYAYPSGGSPIKAVPLSGANQVAVAPAFFP